MYIFKLSQTRNNGYDTYDSCVVIAECTADAKSIHPNGKYRWNPKFNEWRCLGVDFDNPDEDWSSSLGDYDWCAPDDVTVELIGKAIDGSVAGTVVCSSFNAG